MDTVTGYTGGSGGYGNTINTARMQIQLKPLAERKVSVYDVIERLRPKLSVIRGSTNYMQANQDVRVGGRNSASLYQFTMRGDNVQDLTKYGPPMLSALRHLRLINDVNTDQQNSGLQAVVQYDRDTAARFGISSQLIDNVLYDAFGQRQVVHHVHRAQSVPRGDGSGAALLAGSGVSAPDLRVLDPNGGTVPLERDQPLRVLRWRRWR